MLISKCNRVIEKDSGIILFLYRTYKNHQILLKIRFAIVQ